MSIHLEKNDLKASHRSFCDRSHLLQKVHGEKINKIDSLMKKERKFMGAKESLAQKHEMYPRPTFFSTGWKGQKIIQWCYKTITSFCFLKCTIKPEPHSLVPTVNYDNISIVLIHLQQSLGAWLEFGFGVAGVIMTSYSFPEADRTHMGHHGRKAAADEGQNNL